MHVLPHTPPLSLGTRRLGAEKERREEWTPQPACRLWVRVFTMWVFSTLQAYATSTHNRVYDLVTLLQCQSNLQNPIFCSVFGFSRTHLHSSGEIMWCL